MIFLIRFTFLHHFFGSSEHQTAGLNLLISLKMLLIISLSDVLK
jgi:hypothetical protein